jgi:hypothetical protein
MNTSSGSLSPELEALVAPEIESTEHIVWIGQPIPSRYARLNLSFTIFGILWTTFFLFVIAFSCGFKVPNLSQKNVYFSLFCIPFLLCGIPWLLAPYWMFRLARRTAYVITDRRVLTIACRPWGVTVHSFEPTRLSDVKRTQYNDGSGHLVFHREYPIDRHGDATIIEFRIFAVPNVKEVEGHVRKLFHKT